MRQELPKRHIREDEINFAEMPGIELPPHTERTRSMAEDKAYWTGIRNGMMLLINFGTTPDRVLKLHRTAMVELGKLKRLQDDT